MNDGSPISETKTRKRKRRAVLSCNDCRRRKLKCDREQPCDRCINGGLANACSYEQDACRVASVVPSTSEHQQFSLQGSQPPVAETTRLTDTGNEIQPKASPTEILKEDKIERLERTVASLEAHLHSLSATSKNHQSQLYKTQTPNPLGHEGNTALMGMFKGRNYRTFFYGLTSPLTLVMHFPELRPFMKEVHRSSTLKRLREDAKALADTARSNEASSRILSVPYLRSLLPERLTVDILVKKYMDTFETTYRILHIPTFWADYQTFWDSSSGSNSDMEATVLAILACVICTSTHDNTRYNPNGSTFRSKAIIWIKACETWLNRQSNKYRTLATLQVRCLRLLALMTTCLKTKELYQEVQAHLAFMRSSGMHRDPSILGPRCSVFEGEMRRRIWATSIELELQSSIEKGTFSVLSSLQYDCAAPCNVNDSELTTDMQQLPTSNPISVFTDTSFLHCSMETVALRIKLCALTNSLHSSPEFQDILRYEQEIQDSLEMIPTWAGSKPIQAGTLLDLQLRQFIVILHTPNALQTQLREKPNHRYSILTCLNSSVTLIEKHIALMDSGNFALCCIRSDYYRAALLICHIAYHASNSSNSLVKRVAKSIFDDSIEKALRLQEERAMRPGRGSHQYWFISAAKSLAGIQFDPTRIEVLKRQAVDRVSRMLYKTLSLQDDHSEIYLVNEVMFTNEPNPAAVRVSTLVSSASALPSNDFPNGGLPLDGFDVGTSDWMLDDFWFVDDFPTLQFNN